MVKGGCWDIPAFIVGCYGFWCYCSMFHPYLCFLCWGFWDDFAPKVIWWCLVWMRWLIVVAVRVYVCVCGCHPSAPVCHGFFIIIFVFFSSGHPDGREEDIELLEFEHWVLRDWYLIVGCGWGRPACRLRILWVIQSYQVIQLLGKRQQQTLASS